MKKILCFLFVTFSFNFSYAFDVQQDKKENPWKYFEAGGSSPNVKGGRKAARLECRDKIKPACAKYGKGWRLRDKWFECHSGWTTGKNPSCRRGSYMRSCVCRGTVHTKHSIENAIIIR